MKKLTLSALCIMLTGILFAQDQNLSYNKVYPANAFIDNGGNIVDVTQSPFNAVGDGTTDDSDALIAAFNYVADKLATFGYDAPQASYIIYIPDGTYKVSKTIHYTIDLPANSQGKDFLAQLRIYGQSRENTIIKLIDNCPGFESGSETPVISTVNSPENQNQNNWASNNGIKNLTVNIGSGNPGAVGVRFNGANNCRAENLKLISEDGQGYIGYHIFVRPTQGYHSNIIVDGFDYGIAIATGKQHVTHPTFEYLSLTNQNIAGFRLDYSSTTVRKLFSNNTVPAVIITQPTAHMVIIDSDFQGGSSGVPAIQFDAGHLFARNITSSGYGSAIAQGSNILVAGSDVSEYVSGQVYKYDANTPDLSMNLPIEEVPVMSWEDNLNNWAVVDDYGAVGDGTTDDSQAIQAALNSGKPMVYFPKQEYKFGTVNVPATVKRINMGFARLYVSGGFVINENSPDVLFIEDINNRGTGGTIVDHASTRTIVLDHCQSQGVPYTVTDTDPNKKAFILDVTGFGRAGNPFKNVTIFARWVNLENQNPPNFLFDEGSVVNILGYKIEKGVQNTLTRNGGIMEILGGIANITENATLLHETQDGHISIVAATNMPVGERTVDNAVIDTKGGSSTTIPFSSLPDRGGETWYIQGSNLANKVIPLYNGYDRSVIPGNETVAVTGVTFDNCPSSDLTEGTTYQLSASISPTNATDQSVSWSSSNTSVATVDGNGLVNAIAVGSVSITVTTTDGGYSDNCVITIVQGSSVPVEIVNPGYETGDFTGWNPIGTYNIASANKYEGAYAARCRSIGSSIEQTISVNPGKSYTLSVYAKQTGLAYIGVKDIASPVEVEITTTDWTQHTLTFTTSSTDNSATIYTRSAADGQYSYVDLWEITEDGGSSTVSVTGVTIDNCPSSDLTENDTYQLTATVSPSNATNQSVNWSSSNTSVATVNSSGLVTAVSAGTATITVTTNDGGFTDNCVVTVAAPPPTQTPYGGTNRTIPGYIEGEHYDEGGQDIAYNDDATKSGNATFRPDDNVDIGDKATASNGYSVGWSNQGEWLEYTVDVTAGTYDIIFTYSSGVSSPGDLQVSLEGTVLGTFTDISNSGGWTTFTTSTLSGVSVDGGNDKVLKLELVNGAGFDIDAIEFVIPTQPCDPVTIQAEDAIVGGGTLIESNHSGYNGSGFVNMPSSGGYVEFSNIDGCAGGDFTLSYRYALVSSDRTGSLIINGVSQNLTMTGTGGWTTWQTADVTISLDENTNNIIRFESNGNDFGNLDEITLTDNAAKSGKISISEKSSEINNNMYPNPSSNGYVKISVTDEADLNIYNISGQVIYSRSVQAGTHEIGTSDWNDGIYFVKFVNDESNTTVKLIIE